MDNYLKGKKRGLSVKHTFLLHVTSDVFAEGYEVSWVAFLHTV